MTSRISREPRARDVLRVASMAEWCAAACHDETGVPTWRSTSGWRPERVGIHARTLKQPRMSELEFHMSPVCSSSRPHTGVGTDGTRSRTRCAEARSFATRTGLDTASLASGMEPPRHRPTS